MARTRDVDQAQAHLPEEPNRFIGREREVALEQATDLIRATLLQASASRPAGRA